MKLSLAYAILATTAATTSARLFTKNHNGVRKLQDDGIACIALYDPVCGTDGRTYSNDCEAGVAGVTIASKGECERLPVRCPAEIALVCGRDGETYDNECLAEAAGTAIVSKGACPKRCTEEYAPVCGDDGRTYDNTCYAEAARATIASRGECPEVPIMPTATAEDDGIVCFSLYEPVCGADGQTYDNSCKAEKAGTTVASKGVCPEVLPTMSTATPCTEEYAPVCGDDGRTYDNTCYAKAASVTIVSKGVCPEVPTMPTEPAESVPDAEVFVSDMNTDSTTLPSPTAPEATPEEDSPDLVDTTDVPVSVLDDSAGAPSSASTSTIGTATVLAVSAFIFVAV